MSNSGPKSILAMFVLLVLMLIGATFGGYGKGHVTYKGFSGHAGHHHKGYGYKGGHVDYKGFSGHVGHGHKGGGYDHQGGYGGGGHHGLGGYVDHFDDHHH